MQVKQQFPVSSKNLFDATKGVLSSEQGIKFEVDNLIMRIEGNRKTTFMSFPFSFSISISEAGSEKSLLVKKHLLEEVGLQREWLLVVLYHLLQDKNGIKKKKVNGQVR